MAKKVTKKDLQKKVDQLGKRLEVVERRLDQVESAAVHPGGKDPGQAERQPSTSATKTTSAPQKDAGSGATKSAPDSPDESWTVKQLRGEARKREVPSFSTKNKAELLAAIRA